MDCTVGGTNETVGKQAVPRIMGEADGETDRERKDNSKGCVNGRNGKGGGDRERACVGLLAGAHRLTIL